MALLTTHITKKDLEIQICDNLTRHQNASTRASKTPKALWYLRRKLHHKALPLLLIQYPTTALLLILSESGIGKKRSN